MKVTMKMTRSVLLFVAVGIPAVAMGQEGPNLAVDAAEDLDEMREYQNKLEKLGASVPKDDVKKEVECIESPRQRMDVLVKVSMKAEDAIKSAIAGGNPDRAQHEYRKIAIARAKVQELYGEAKNLWEERKATRSSLP